MSLEEEIKKKELAKLAKAFAKRELYSHEKEKEMGYERQAMQEENFCRHTEEKEPGLKFNKKYIDSLLRLKMTHSDLVRAMEDVYASHVQSGYTDKVKDSIELALFWLDKEIEMREK